MPTPKPSTQGKKLLTVITWLLFFGGLFGSLVGFVKVSHHVPPSDYVGIGIGSGLWLLFSAVVVFIRSRL